MGKVLITGANGLLGQKLCQQFFPSYQVIAIDLHPQSFIPSPDMTYHSLDITNRERVVSFIQFHHPDLIANAAAYTDVDGCEIHQKEARAVNVEAVETLVGICRKLKIRLIQLSTDYVFDGENGPYAEEDPPHPVSYYGKTKLESEQAIRSSGIDFLIVRTNVLYGWGKKVKPNFLLWLLEKLSGGEKIGIVTDQLNNPTLVDNLSSCILEMAERNLTGTFHVGGTEYLSRYDFALQVADKFDFDKSLISSVRTTLLAQPAQRPHRGGLKIEKARKFLKTKLLNVEEGLELVKRVMRERE
jgi:dTDP-4-dehydrorhamnose reductase